MDGVLDGSLNVMCVNGDVGETNDQRHWQTVYKGYCLVCKYDVRDEQKAKKGIQKICISIAGVRVNVGTHFYS